MKATRPPLRTCLTALFAAAAVLTFQPLQSAHASEDRAADRKVEVHKTVYANSMQRERLEELAFVGPIWRIGWGQNTRFTEQPPGR